MVFGKRFRAYLRNYPQAEKPTANRCSRLNYKELKAMAKNMYSVNEATKAHLYRYQNMGKNRLANAVYKALGCLN